MSFKPEDESNKETNQNEDNFGLPDLDYKPLDKLEEKPVSESPQESPLVEESKGQSTFQEESTEREVEQEHRSIYTPMMEEPKSKAPIVIGIIIVLVVAAAGYLIYDYVIKPNAEKERLEKIAKDKIAKEKEEAARLARQREEEERQRIAAEAAAKATPDVGAIEALSAPTGRYYVVVASAIDGDLIMDYAKKLSVKGLGSKIIPPFGKTKFNRLAITDHDNYSSAQTAADGVKGEYGSAVWVVRY